MFLSCGTSSVSQGGKHFKALKGLGTLSLISCGVRAAPYLHRHGDAAARVTPPTRWVSHCSCITLHAPDPLRGGLVNTMSLTKQLVLKLRWVSSISGCTRVLPAGNRQRAGARDSCTGGEAEFQTKAGNSLLSCKSNSLEPKWVEGVTKFIFLAGFYIWIFLLFQGSVGW